jgi:HAE1 family hydrophobic/amphiphilic exporter-1
VIRFKGREAVELAIYKEGDANTVSTAEAVRKALNRMETTGAGGGTGATGMKAKAANPNASRAPT